VEDIEKMREKEDNTDRKLISKERPSVRRRPAHSPFRMGPIKERRGKGKHNARTLKAMETFFLPLDCCNEAIGI